MPYTNNMETLELIKSRYSTVLFDSKPLESDKLLRLFEAVRWSSSASNLQPWHFIYAVKDKPDEFQKLASLLNEGNYWAKNAPLLILSMAKMDSKYGPNRHAFHDVGLATAYMMLEATSLGLGMHPMAGFSIEKAKQIYFLPANIEPVAMIAIGYPGNIEDASEALKEKEIGRKKRIRKEQEEFVFEGEWENG